MSLFWAPYYQLARVNGDGPETLNWAVTDSNWKTTSLLLKRFEGHHHNSATPIGYPGFNPLNPATPATPLLTLNTTSGSLPAGANIGIRVSFLDQYGLETQGSPEVAIQTPSVVQRPASISIGSPFTTPVGNGLPGGTYIYAMTKRLSSGESLLSDVSTVDVPFNTTVGQSYVVPLNFSPINSYSDGTDSLCLYRTTGFDTNFQLIQTITATPGLQNALTSYTDIGTVQDSTHQPPLTSEFGQQNSVVINWATLNIPSTAYRFRLYVTQQAGVWGISHILQDYALVNPATPFPSSYTYLGTETLTVGYPLDFTQIPFGAPAVYLPTEAIGAPYYTQPANAQGWATWNFVFPTLANSTPVFGNAYIDASIGGNAQLKLCLSTPAGPGNPGVYTTLAGVGTGYAHPLAESGGHVASHIWAAPTGIGGPTQDLINNLIATPVAGPSQNYRKQVENVYRVTATPADMVQSTVGQWTQIADMTTATQFPGGISPQFTGQWFQIEFQTFTELQATTSLGGIITAVLTINGIQIPETMCPMGGIHATPTGLIYGQLNFAYSTPLTRPNNVFAVQWMLSQPGFALSFGGNVPGQNPRRYFIVNETF